MIPRAPRATERDVITSTIALAWAGCWAEVNEHGLTETEALLRFLRTSRDGLEGKPHARASLAILGSLIDITDRQGARGFHDVVARLTVMA